VYFEGDEAHFASIGHSLFESGRNLRGDFLPVMVEIGDPLGGPPMPWGNTYYQPLLFYVIAATLHVLPFNEASARLPVAMIGGVIAPLLMYGVAYRVIGSRAGAIAAAAVLGLSPANVLISRRALDYVGPLPFVLAWIWCLWSWTRERRNWQAFAVGLILGSAVYSYITSWLLMPIYLAVSAIVFARASVTPLKTLALSWSGFALALLPLLGWVALHPDTLRDTFARYEMADQQTSLLTGDPAAILGVLDAYASYFDPRLWFVYGSPSLTTSTGRVGVFLLPIAVLCPLGLYVLYQRRRQNPMAMVILVGLLTAALPAALARDGSMIQRAMGLVVFVAIVCGFAVDHLWHSPWRLLRHATITLTLLGVVQFGVFYRDYFTHYKFRSAFYYDPVAFADVASLLLRQPGEPHYYFHSELDDAATKWRFYATKADRTEVLSRTHYVERDQFPIDDAPINSLCVTYVDRPTFDALTSSNAWAVIHTVHDVDNREAASIFVKVREGRRP
jgi:4-amino-4-deoxy-L-arabinose transferase-like glycosyltransferase